MPIVEPTAEDHKWMVIALSEAEAAAQEEGVPVGSVMVKDGLVIGKGHNRSRSNNDPTSHAEIECIRNGGLRQGYDRVTLYTTVSPCLMCIGALLFVGIRRVVIGDCRSFKGDVALMVTKGVEVALTNNERAYELMADFARRDHAFWVEFASGSPLLHGN